MLKPSVKTLSQDNILIAEFWDCLRLDPMPVQDLRQHYESHLRQGGRPELVVDLGGVGFAGSSALGIFVGLHRFARQNGGRLIFCNVEPTVRDVFRASKMDSLFEFVPDRASAFDSIERGPRPKSSGSKDDGQEVVDAPSLPPTSTVTEEPTGIGRFRRRRDGSDPARS